MSTKKLKLVILANENSSDHELWVKVCEKKKNLIDFGVINLTENDWLDEIISSKADCFLAKPPGFTAHFKQLYDERLWIINYLLNLLIYPSLEEILVYENKRLLFYWLKANNIPHPKTNVFYFKKEASLFIEKSKFPLVVKTNIGASGSGVRILKSKNNAKDYVDKVFSGKGAPKRWGPNLEKGGLLKRSLHYVFHPKDIREKLNVYRQKKYDVQKGLVIFQEFIPHNFEWRCVRIGDSFFAHKKIVKGEKASGSLIKRYENPPLELLDFVKAITDKREFLSQAIDIFETSDERFLVNEMQCFFGQSDPYQMLVGKEPGRYILKNNKWIFEKGDFNTNKSYDLRLEHILKLLKEKRI